MARILKWGHSNKKNEQSQTYHLRKCSTLTLSLIIIYITLSWWVLYAGTAHTNSIIFGMTWHGIEQHMRLTRWLLHHGNVPHWCIDCSIVACYKFIKSIILHLSLRINQENNKPFLIALSLIKLCFHRKWSDCIEIKVNFHVFAGVTFWQEVVWYHWNIS